jgi:ClpP class serine protease
MNRSIEIIKRIQEIRNSKVITYITGDRQGINPAAAMIQPADLREIYDHLIKLDTTEKIDLLIYSRGGNSVTAWALVNLIREFTKNFNVLIPFRAHSCATAIAIGAEEIVMARMAELGPVDPTLTIVDEGKQLNVSTEDLSSYIEFLKKKFGIKAAKNTIHAFKELTQNIKPLTIGRAYRSYLKARDDTSKILGIHITKKKKIKNITNQLVEKLLAHDHIINRKEAKETIGLNVTFAKGELEKLMWEIFTEYEKMMQLKTPYRDSPTAQGKLRKIPLVVFESENLRSVKNINQTISQIQLNMPNINQPQNPQGQEDQRNQVIYTPLFQDNKACIMLSNGKILQIGTQGTATVIDNQFYDKVETIKWEQEEINDDDNGV